LVKECIHVGSYRKAGSIQASGWNETQKTDAQEKTQRFKVDAILGHPLFTDTYDYDVALLKLDRKIDLVHPDAPTPICLPPLGTTESYDNTMPVISVVFSVTRLL